MWLRVHQLDRGRTEQARNETVVSEVLCYGIRSAYKNEAQRPHVGDRLTVRTWAGTSLVTSVSSFVEFPLVGCLT
jgi:hypothetical protein